VIDGIDQHRHPEHVGEQDELLADWRTLLAGPGQKIDRIFPFLEGEVGSADVLVQRFHQFLKQEFRARFGRIVKAADYGGGEFSLVELRHFWLSCRYADGRCQPTPPSRAG